MTDRCCGETYDAVIDVHQNLPAQDRWCGERQFDDEDICIFQIGVSRLCASMKARRLLVCLALVSLAALPMSRAEDVNLKTALRLAASDWASKILDDGDGDPKGTQLDRERLDEGICIDRLTCEGKAEYKDTANQVTDAEWQSVEVSDPEWTTEPKSTGPGEYKPAIKARNCCITKGKDLTVTCTNTVEKEIKHENSLTTTTANTFESSTSLSAGFDFGAVGSASTTQSFTWSQETSKSKGVTTGDTAKVSLATELEVSPVEKNATGQNCAVTVAQLLPYETVLAGTYEIKVTGSIQIFLKDARNMDEVGGAGAVQEYGHPPNDGSEWWRVPVDRLIEKGQCLGGLCNPNGDALVFTNDVEFTALVFETRSDNDDCKKSDNKCPGHQPGSTRRLM